MKVRQRAARRRVLDTLYEAQNGICASCGRRMAPLGDYELEHRVASVDHVIARAAGGGDHIGNMMAMHRQCNSSKGDRPPNGCERVFHHFVLARLDIHPLDRVWNDETTPNTAMAEALRSALFQRSIWHERPYATLRVAPRPPDVVPDPHLFLRSNVMRNSIPNPRPAAELVAEIHDELYEAVYAGDLTTAKAKLDELAMTGTESFRGRIYAAKRRAGVLS